MNYYIFIHGKNASLSQAELKSVLGEDIVHQAPGFSIVETKQTIDQDFLNRLGGTIKVCEGIQGNPVDVIEQSAERKKILFGLSQYGGHEQLSKPLNALKRELKDRGHNARFVNKQFANISSGQLNKSGLMEKGVDLVRCFGGGKTWWGKTVAFQDIDAYSKRDYDKPKRDMKVGMLPPKLSQMMINFAQPEKGTTIYDPFCGLGTLPMEGLLRGNPVMGSDLKGRMIDSTLRNLEWMKAQFSIPSDHPTTIQEFFQHDATQDFVAKKYPKDLVVVTEGYLGPAQKKVPHREEQSRIFELLHGINSQFFSTVSQIIPTGKRLVICLPYFREKKENRFYPEAFIRSYEQHGFKLQQELRSLMYERQNQVVGREIMVFEKTN